MTALFVEPLFNQETKLFCPVVDIIAILIAQKIIPDLFLALQKPHAQGMAVANNIILHLGRFAECRLIDIVTR